MYLFDCDNAKKFAQNKFRNAMIYCHYLLQYVPTPTIKTATDKYTGKPNTVCTLYVT